MAKSRKALRDEMKERYLKMLIKFFSETEEVLRVKSNEIAFPIVDDEGNEDFMVITLKIPTGANKGTEPYDGYSMAQEYEINQRLKKEKAKEKAEAKAKKIERDKEYRRKKAEAKAKAEAEKIEVEVEKEG